jgi:adenylate kinase family enzyme
MRVAIVGNSGSGKSTLARRLAAEAAVPILDLDTVAWEPGMIAVARDADEAIADVRRFCQSNDSWIIEGCYASLVATTLQSGPQLLVLDPGLQQCVSNCRSRPWEPHKYSSKEEQDGHLEFLLEWVAAYYSRNDDMSLTAHRSLYEGYNGPEQWLTTLHEAIQPTIETRWSVQKAAGSKPDES